MPGVAAVPIASQKKKAVTINQKAVTLTVENLAQQAEKAMLNLI
jgi:hypothetical protein